MIASDGISLNSRYPLLEMSLPLMCDFVLCSARRSSHGSHSVMQCSGGKGTTHRIASQGAITSETLTNVEH
jgi:hypothetical protein